MPSINPDSLDAVRHELLPSETVLWAGRPQLSVIFHKEDSLLIPFSLLWGGFAIFWEAAASGHGFGRFSNASLSPWSFGMIWGMAFVLIGQYLIWGRFFYAAWRKRQTHYAITDRRVIAVQTGWPRHVSSAFIDTLPALIKQGGSRGIGTLRFTPRDSIWSQRRGWASWSGLSAGDWPAIVDVEDVDSLYRVIAGLRENGSGEKRQF